MRGRLGPIYLMAAALVVLPAVALFANGAKESGPVTLNWPSIWVGKDTKAPAIAALVEEFNNAHTGKIQVAVEPNPDYDGYRDKINTQIAAGQVPDIFIFNPDPTTFQYYQGNVLMDFTKDLQGEWGNQFVPGTIKQATKNGATKSLPYEIGVTPIWYNKALFAKAGINSLPRTMDEFWADCDKLKAAGITPTTQMTGGSNAWTSMLWYSHILASLGGADLWDKPLFQGQIYVDAATILQRMYQDGNTSKDAVGADANAAGAHWLAGQTAMFLNGPWYIARVKKDAPDVYANTELAPLPKVSGGTYGATIAFPLSNLAAGNTDNSAKRSAVITFLKFMTMPGNVKKISESSGSLFAIKYKVDPSKVDPLQAQFIENLNNAAFAIPHIQYQLPAKVTAQLGQGFGAMALGKMTPQQFVDFMHQQLLAAQ